jgi:hypothetical protein
VRVVWRRSEPSRTIRCGLGLRMESAESSSTWRDGRTRTGRSEPSPPRRGEVTGQSRRSRRGILTPQPAGEFFVDTNEARGDRKWERGESAVCTLLEGTEVYKGCWPMKQILHHGATLQQVGDSCELRPPAFSYAVSIATTALASSSHSAYPSLISNASEPQSPTRKGRRFEQRRSPSNTGLECHWTSVFCEGCDRLQAHGRPEGPRKAALL